MKTFNKNKKTVTVENLRMQVFFEKTSPLPQKGELPFQRQLHAHLFVEFFACLKGSITLRTADGLDTVLQAGDVAIVPPAVKHFKAPKTTPETKWVGFGFVCRKAAGEFETDLYGSFDRLTRGDRVFHYSDEKTLCALAENCNKAQGQQELASVLAFLSALIPLAEQQGAAGMPQGSAGSPKDIERLLVLDEIVHHCTEQDLSQKQIAALLFISERQLSRIAQKRYGMSLKGKMTERRLSVAVELLETTHKSAEQIGEQAGFKNRNAFYREFKKQYAVTPQQYRKQHKQK